jgi:hypothetical protein
VNFKPGDRVRVCDDGGYDQAWKNKTATIIKESPAYKDCFLLKFDDGKDYGSSNNFNIIYLRKLTPLEEVML